MKKKKRSAAVPILWFIFIILVAGIAYLSFQDGASSKQLGAEFIKRLAQSRHPEQAVTTEELRQVTYIVRQGARVVAFLIIGIVGTVTIHVTCQRSCWLVKTVIAAVILFVIAYFTEALKEYIPTRHYSYDEMLLSMAAAATGFLMVSAMSLFFTAVKKVIRLTTAH